MQQKNILPIHIFNELFLFFLVNKYIYYISFLYLYFLVKNKTKKRETFDKKNEPKNEFFLSVFNS